MRWAELPDHALELPADSRLPAGFRASGVSCGIKPQGALDLGLLVAGAGTVSAARFCDSGVLAAPVVLMQEQSQLDALQVIVANSGNANAATGAPGLEQAARVQGAGAVATGVQADRVGVASTGVIGVPLDSGKVLEGLRDAAQELREDGAVDFAQAIRTTDALDKHASLELALPSGTVRLSAQCKGAGMISPRFATLLCFVETDAAMSPETADLLLGVCVKRSFERISVDGQLSTNDTVVLMASGQSAVRIEPESADELRFGEALDALLRRLALLIVRDGEGAHRIARVHVRGGDALAVERVARSVANSPLVKSALFGGDPNWGRIAQAIGSVMPGSAPLSFEIAIEGVAVCGQGAALGFDEDALREAVSGPEVEYAIDLPGEGAECELFFSDLSYEYVRINAEYTS